MISKNNIYELWINDQKDLLKLYDVKKEKD